jgi:hypothetical protein
MFNYFTKMFIDVKLILNIIKAKKSTIFDIYFH